MFEGFEEQRIPTADSTIYARIGGSGPPLLLLHGFPETHLMWRDVAPLLGRDFTIVCADLPGQGDSGIPDSDSKHAPFSKRAMARQLIEAMRQLGFDRFAAAGHDRGGRVAYRMAIDHSSAIQRVAVLDVIPIAEAWDHADSRLTLAFWPWSLLAQPAPLPERLIAKAPHAVIEDATSQWGTPANCFPHEIREAYAHQLRDPQRVHAICEEFRAAATLDCAHDVEDRKAGRKVQCPLLILWDADGALANWYGDQGGPIAIWKQWAPNLYGEAVTGGHFFPEAHPGETAGRLRNFFLGPA